MDVVLRFSANYALRTCSYKVLTFSQVQYLPYVYLTNFHIILFTVMSLEVGWEGTVLVYYETKS